MKLRGPLSSPKLLIFLTIVSLVFTSCSVNPQSTQTITLPFTAGEVLEPQAEVEFTAVISAPFEQEQTLTLEILDEVTGLALNPQRYQMQPVNATTYSLKLPVQIGSVIKYRYIRESSGVPVYEYNSIGRQVRYRMAYVTNSSQIHDMVIAWNTQPYQGPYGRIQGKVINSDTGVPVPASMVTVAGQDTLTTSDGSFLVDRIPPGIHNLVVYSLDGSYSVFQQEAEVAVDSATPANILVSLADTVQVTFVVQPPDGSPIGIPIRILGNIYPLGNTFADLRGGISGIASRAPLLKLRDDGKYEITLQLPVGLDLRYKYTLGDGFWNAERTDAGAFRLRQLIVSSDVKKVEETITTWSTPGKSPITFKVTVPASTPSGDTVSIQFNPYGWTEPLPMWPLGSNRWLYVLYGPLDLIGESAYRYCRNEQCGSVDDEKTKGPDAAGKPFKPSADTQVFEDQVREWTWSAPPGEVITVPSGDIPAKPAGFTTAVELSSDYHPSWQPYYPQAFQEIARSKAGTVIISPSWHFYTANPPTLGIVPGVDPSWYDLSQMIVQARQQNLQIAIHPTTAFYQPSALWWAEAARDSNWWQSWFDRYEAFILNHADLAEQSGTDVLILGEENILPALPGGTLIGGAASGVPGIAEARWRDIIKHVRSRYKGKIGWYLNYKAGATAIPAFVSEVDQIYVVLSENLSDSDIPTPQELAEKANSLINTDLRGLVGQVNKPVILGIAYPSVKGSASGCIRSSDACLPAAVFAQGGLDIPSVEIDPRLQADIYNAILQAVSQSDWLSGVFSVGYFPPVAIVDQSISVRAKPAGDVMWFWFDKFTSSNQ
jgi:hypothetical protein